MDSWGFASDESPSTGKGKIGPMNWEVKAPFIFTNNMGLFPNEENIDRQVFVEMGLRNSLFNPVMAATQNAFSEENESSSKLESNCRESELFDLKPCRIIEQREAQIFNSSKIYHNFSPSEASTPSKRPRVGGFGSSTPFCQVYGCNKNLSSCKDYHKRHKVCEVHSKTAKAIVNGIEQRFCQQCSRFHLLCEFDDGKRSCRKRLAGHNERRRKPHVGVVSGRHERLLPSYSISVEGNQFKGSTGAISSFPLSNPHRSSHQQKHEPNRWCQMNLEDQTPHDLQSISSITDEQLHSQSLDGIINGYIGASNSSSTGLSMVSSSGSALSLLSSQSQSTSCYSSRIHMSNSHSHSYFMFPGSNYELTQDSRVLHYMNPVLDSEGSLVIFGDDGMFRGSKHVNSYQVFSNEGRTIDLLQLSSQLERLEHQKRTNGVSVGLSIT